MRARGRIGIAALVVAGCAPDPEGPAAVDSDDHAGALAELPTQPGGSLDPAVEAFDWGLPDWAPRPRVPAFNPMTAEKVALGRALFYDTRLSGNQTQSCASCHDQALGFADGRALSPGSTGETTHRNSMALVNVAYMTSLNWANPTTTTLEQQTLIPLFGENPVELGLTGREDEVYGRFEADPAMAAMFEAAFPDAVAGEPLVTTERVVFALASFVRSMVSFETPVDRSAYGGEDTLSPAAVRGMDLFFSERLECHHCHGSWNFSLTTTHAGQEFDQLGFQNNGLYNLDGNGAYPADNTGLFEFTSEWTDMGRFRPPTLRNVALTAPYMHDGSVATLEEVVDIYAAGGRVIPSGARAGDGRVSPVKSSFVPGFDITAGERADLVAFLEALTDEAFLTDPRWSDPGGE